MTRYQFADLEPYIEREYRDPGNERQSYIGICGKAATILEVNAITVQNWRRRGLTEPQADWVACRLGYHPASIWPHWWDGANLSSDPDADMGTLVA